MKRYKVHAVIQSTVPGSTDEPVCVTWYEGNDLALAISAMTAVVAHGDDRYTELLSVTFADNEKKARL